MSLIYKGQTVANVGGGSSGVSMEQVNAAIQDAVADIQPQEVYSTEETRIGTWIDGKPLYRVVVTGSLSSPITGTIYQLSSMMFDGNPYNLHRLWGYFTDKHNNPSYRFPSADCHATVLYAQWYPAIEVPTDRAGAGTPYVAVLEYTKTTDEATS